jgi:hypothetical protein
VSRAAANKPGATERGAIGDAIGSRGPMSRFPARLRQEEGDHCAPGRQCLPRAGLEVNMKRNVLATLGVALLLGWRPAAAPMTVTNIWGPPGEMCTVSAPCTNTFAYPIPQGRTTTIDVEGQFVDLSTGLEASPSSDITVTSAGQSSSHKLVRIAVQSDAAPGVRTIKLHYLVETNGPDTFKIMILRAGKVTSITTPTPDDYFNDVTVTFNGQHLDNAKAYVVPTTIGTFSVGGSQFPQTTTLTQTTATATVTQSTSSQASVKVHFIGGPFAEAKATVILYDGQISNQDECLQHRAFCYQGIDPGTLAAQSTFDVVGPNAVSSITFPTGSQVRVGSPVTVRIRLVKPVQDSQGATVHWQVVPSTSFHPAAGSGTSFSPTHDNIVTIAQNEQFKDVTVQLVSLPAGCGKLGCSATVQTRMVNFTNDQPPYLRLAQFQIVAQ